MDMVASGHTTTTPNEPEDTGMPSRDDVRKYVGIVLTKAPVLIFMLGIKYLKIKRRARKAEKTFRKRLLASGVDRDVADRLSEQYGSTVSIREMLSNFSGNGNNVR